MNNADFLNNERERNLWNSMITSSWQYYAWLAFLFSVIALGFYAYLLQLRNGLIVTGLRDQISWGVYITDFVFFIGISHAGTLISSILRLTHANWRQPITRLAEAITVSALMIGGLMPLIDMGRPERVLNMIIYGRIQSNLLWDIFSIATYLTGSLLFLWLLMVPDIAMLRDNYPDQGRFRKTLYKMLALGYQNTSTQSSLLEKANHAMTIIILPLAISVHTVVAWIFAMSLRPGWNSSIFGPYFVVGAIFSGIAASILAMAAFRKIYRLQDYIKPLHFCNLGYLLLTLTLIYLYFNINEYLTIGYKMAEHDRHLLDQLFSGQYAWLFWGVQLVGVLIPTALLITVLGIGKLRERFAISGTVIASVLVIIGAWFKRYMIVVPTLSSPFLPTQNLSWEWMNYRPTWIEWSITAAAFAGFLLFYTIFSKLFPIISIWETREVETETSQAKEAKPTSNLVSLLKPGVVSMLAILMLFSFTARAEENATPIKPAPTAINISSTSKGESPNATVTINANLTTTDGKPVPDMPVQFEMKTLFGKLKLGLFPTDENGKATIKLNDKRYGKYRITANFRGDDAYKASSGAAEIDFGTRPAPSLPSEGVLIAPYSSFIVALPFLIFYGSCWVVFFYVGYLTMWRMRREQTSK